MAEPLTRIEEIRSENHQGDVAANDIAWLCDHVESYYAALSEIAAYVDAPGRPVLALMAREAIRRG